MFELILHGTTQAIYDTNGKLVNAVPKATAAYFKSGIWPEARKSSKSANDYFNECALDESFFIVDAVAESPVLRITAEDMSKAKNADAEREEEEKKNLKEALERRK